MAEHIEKQRFYISEFKQEEAWLSFMQREGYRFCSTDGYTYRFETCEKEDWCYQLDYKEDGMADEDYIQIYTDYGWEYVFQYKHWFYFRKKREAGKEEDLSIFSDNESKIAFCKRVINGAFLRLLPGYALLLLYDGILLFTDLLKQDGFIGGLLNGIGVGAILVWVFGLGVYIGQLGRLNRMVKELEKGV